MAVGIGMKRFVWIALGLWALVAPVASGQPAQNPRFGLIGASTRPADADDLGAGWEQITFDWRAFQPDGPDDFDTDAVDPDLLETRREIVGLIVHTPEWASESGRANAVPDGLDLPPDDPDNVWGAFITRLVDHYAPLGVRHWVIYDSPDVRLGEGPVMFAGEVEDYARLLAVAYQAANEADPRAVIHVAAMYWWADVAAGRTPYLSRLLRVLLVDPDAPAHNFYFDVVRVRVFNETLAVEDMLAAVRIMLEQAGLSDKLIWLETNASPTLDERGGTSTPLFGITPAQQADFVIQVSALGLAAGAERIGLYRLADENEDDPPWGLIRADGSRRPAFEAYRLVIDLFEDTQAATRYANAYAEFILLDQGDQVVAVMWARGDTLVEFLITGPEAGEEATLIDPAGRERRLVAEVFNWPAAFTVAAPPALRDEHGFLTVAGSPRIVVLDNTTDFFRVVYARVNGEPYRLK